MKPQSAHACLRTVQAEILRFSLDGLGVLGGKEDYYALVSPLPVFLLGVFPVGTWKTRRDDQYPYVSNHATKINKHPSMSKTVESAGIHPRRMVFQ